MKKLIPFCPAFYRRIQAPPMGAVPGPDACLRSDITSDDRERILALEREMTQLLRANQILETARVFLARAGRGSSGGV